MLRPPAAGPQEACALVGEAYQNMVRGADIECEVELFEEKHLGSANRLAIYSARSPNGALLARRLSVPTAKGKFVSSAGGNVMIWDIGDVASSRTLTDCQGGSIEACVGACPSSSFAACVESCATRCSDAPTPSPDIGDALPTPSATAGAARAARWPSASHLGLISRMC